MEMMHLASYWPQIAASGAFVLICAAVCCVSTPMWRSDAGRVPAERRFYRRMRRGFKGSLDFNGRRVRARGINLDRSGALVKSRVAAQPGSPVFLYLESERLMGWATVRHCSRKGLLGYRVGMQFRGSLIRAEAGNWEFQCLAER